MTILVITSKRLTQKIMRGTTPGWTFERWPNPSTFFYSYGFCKKLGNRVLRHNIVDWNPSSIIKKRTKLCTVKCKKLQEGDCPHLSVREIKEILDATDWDDEDKGEVLMPYIIKENVK